MKIVLPAIYTALDPFGGGELMDPYNSSDVTDYIVADMSISRLERVDRHLWFAGDVIKRPLTLIESLAEKRSIRLTDQADTHMVTHLGKIYLKRFPDYLFSSVM